MRSTIHRVIRCAWLMKLARASALTVRDSSGCQTNRDGSVAVVDRLVHWRWGAASKSGKSFVSQKFDELPGLNRSAGFFEGSRRSATVYIASTSTSAAVSRAGGDRESPPVRKPDCYTEQKSARVCFSQDVIDRILTRDFARWTSGRPKHTSSTSSVVMPRRAM